jgi:hypothetical protein
MDKGLPTAVERGPWNSAKGQILRWREFDQTLEQYVNVWDWEVPHAQMYPAAYGIFIRYYNERNTKKSRVQLRFVDGDGEGDPVFEERLSTRQSSDPFSDLENVTKKIIGKDENPETVFDSIAGGCFRKEATVTHVDEFHNEVMVVWVDAWKVVREVEEDADLKAPVCVTKEIVCRTEPPPPDVLDECSCVSPMPVPSAGTPLNSVEVVQLDAWKNLVVRKEICDESIEEEFVEWADVRYSFPALWTDLNASVVKSQTGRTHVFTNVVVKPSRDSKIPARIVTTYHDEEPTPDEIFVFDLKDITYQGPLISFSVRGVICNASTDTARYINFVTVTDDYWPSPFANEVNWSASSPSLDEYLALVGNPAATPTPILPTPILISSVVEPWKYNLWRKRNTWVTPR